MEDVPYYIYFSICAKLNNLSTPLLAGSQLAVPRGQCYWGISAGLPPHIWRTPTRNPSVAFLA